MAIIGVDLTVANLVPDGDYQGQVQSVAYQIKVGEKWNKEGTQDTTDIDQWNAMGPKQRRLQYRVGLVGKGNHFADFYMMENCLGFLQAFMKACGVPFTKDGFDPDAAVGTTCNVNVTTSDDPEYGMSNNFKYTKI